MDNHRPGILRRIFRFFPRQFAAESTRAQRIADWILGVGVFVLLRLLDFPGSGGNILDIGEHGRILFQRLDIHVPLFSLAALGGLIFLLLKREIHPGVLIPVASTQFVGAVLWLIVGLLMLPLALYCLGSLFHEFAYALSLGSWVDLLKSATFTIFLLLPWFPFSCFLRNGFRSVRRSCLRYGPMLPSAVTVFILAVLLGLTWPYLGTFPPWEEMMEMWQDFGLDL